MGIGNCEKIACGSGLLIISKDSHIDISKKINNISEVNQEISFNRTGVGESKVKTG